MKLRPIEKVNKGPSTTRWPNFENAMTLLNLLGPAISVLLAPISSAEPTQGDRQQERWRAAKIKRRHREQEKKADRKREAEALRQREAERKA